MGPGRSAPDVERFGYGAVFLAAVGLSVAFPFTALPLRRALRP